MSSTRDRTKFTWHVACAGCRKILAVKRDSYVVYRGLPYCFKCAPDHEDDDHGLPIAVEEGSDGRAV